MKLNDHKPISLSQVISIKVYIFLICSATSAFGFLGDGIRARHHLPLKMSFDTGRNLKLDVEGGVISYDFFSPVSQSSTSSSSKPIGIAYLPGLVRQRNEAKSINLQTLCRREELYFLVMISFVFTN